ncbi:MAG TPA: PQQ-dependent sugar dehydrogenase [Thermoleophilaceae bacterium]|nr:PQQ-dependent sugar dehydrogenase [Thermoleophilaceae bacterium]
MKARRRLAVFLVLPALAACNGSDGDPPMAVTEPSARGVEDGETAQKRVKGLGRRQIGTFSSPVYVTAPPGDRRRIFVVEQEGTIRIVRRGRKLRRPFLDISGRVDSGGEQGLLSMAFAPNYRKNRRFYVYYTDNGGDVRIVEFRGRRNRARRRSARPVLRQEHSTYSNHNGGQLQFGPDGRLYIGIGDGGGGGDPFEAGQDRGTFLGKILRINPRGKPYRIPGSNPFRGRRGAKGAVYSYGLRNPWRFSFDRKTGALTIGDVGQNEYEEIDFVRRGRGRGANFGWDAFEGNHSYEGGSAPGHIRPVIEHSHGGDGFCSITGGYVLRHRSYRNLRGVYVYGDFCESAVRGARLRPGRARARRRMGVDVPSLSSFGEDARGRVYATSLSGAVYRLVPRR